MTDYGWKYRCSICGELIEVEDATKHMAVEKKKPDWPGHMSYSREDIPKEQA